MSDAYFACSVVVGLAVIVLFVGYLACRIFGVVIQLFRVHDGRCVFYVSLCRQGDVVLVPGDDWVYLNSVDEKPVES